MKTRGYPPGGGVVLIDVLSLGQVLGTSIQFRYSCKVDMNKNVTESAKSFDRCTCLPVTIWFILVRCRGRVSVFQR